MKSRFHYILYVILTLIFISGLLLFIFKDDVFVSLSDNAGVMSPEMIIKNTNVKSQATLDDKILSDPKFLILKNNIVKFDFEAICKNAVAEVRATSTNSEGDIISTLKTINCALGNNNPFPLPKQKKD